MYDVKKNIYMFSKYIYIHVFKKYIYNNILYIISYINSYGPLPFNVNFFYRPPAPKQIPGSSVPCPTFPRSPPPPTRSVLHPTPPSECEAWRSRVQRSGWRCPCLPNVNIYIYVHICTYIYIYIESS